jgi:hypothetical protein
VAAPLLIQDIATWMKSGIGGLQSVILYALPELDGAIDTVALGGLVGDDIYLTRERVYALAGRLTKWWGPVGRSDLIHPIVQPRFLTLDLTQVSACDVATADLIHPIVDPRFLTLDLTQVSALTWQQPSYSLAS